MCGLEAFAAAERAKRRLLFELLDSLSDRRRQAPLRSAVEPRPTRRHRHDDGLITLDLAESDDARRELRRTQLGEPYRTLLGHFRHEIGHYYWPALVEQRVRMSSSAACAVRQ